MIAQHILVSGKVQGVGFRNFTARCAKNLKIAGWVRNLSSGEVEIFAQASANAMADFLTQIKRGPERSHVTSLKISDRSAEQNLSDFGVKADL